MMTFLALTFNVLSRSLAALIKVHFEDSPDLEDEEEGQRDGSFL